MSDGQPNILFLFPDQWRWDWLGCASEYAVSQLLKTPTIDGLAARGVRFTQCRTNSPLCSPARACLATCRRYHRTGVVDNNQITDPTMPTFFEALRDAGYQVATCGKSDLFKPLQDANPKGFHPMMREYGFTSGIDSRGKWDSARFAREGIDEPYWMMLQEQGLLETHLSSMERFKYSRVELKSISTEASPLDGDLHADGFTAANAVKLLNGFEAEEPWMLWVNFPGPHEPFDPPERYQREFDEVAFEMPVNGESGVPQDHQQLRRNYAAMMTFIDDQIARILGAVEARGELENTVVIFASDHGEMLGDHGKWYKQVPEEASVHVPLIVAGAGVSESVWGTVDDRLVELIDVGTTCVELAGGVLPAGIDGVSFASALRGTPGEKRGVQVSQLGDWRMIFDGRFKLVETEGQADRLYDLVDDPDELRDVAGVLGNVVVGLKEGLVGELG